MKYLCLVFLFVIIATALADEPRDTWLRNRAGCQIETKLKDTTLAKALLEKAEAVDDPKLKDYCLCMLKKIDHVDDNGELKRENIKKDLEKKFGDKTDEVMKKCVGKKDTPGETAMEMIRCVKNHAKSGEPYIRFG